MNNFDIDLIPGFVSVIDLNCQYVAVNQKLADLFNIDKESFPGMLAGSQCNNQRQIIKELIDTQIGTEITWEYDYNEVCLFVSSRREQYYIFNQAVDITQRKNLEQKLIDSNKRNTTLLRSIPDAISFAENRRSTDQLKLLVKALLDNPIIEQRESIESLIKLEVELREATLKVREIEKLLYTNSDSLLSRLKTIEVFQDGDNEKWKELDKIKELSNNLSKASKLVSSVPGGLKSWLIIFVVLQMLGILCIDLGIRVFKLETVIPIERINK